MEGVMKWSAPLLFILIFLSNSYPKTITVELLGGGDYTEIHPAIDAAQDGDTMLVQSGEYVISEPINFNRLHNRKIPIAGR